MSKERMTGDATGWKRGARGIDGVGKPLAPFSGRRSTRLNKAKPQKRNGKVR